MVLGVAMLTSYGLLVASIVLSAAWVAAAAIVFVIADFTADKLWGDGLMGLVASSTSVVAALSRQRNAPHQCDAARR
jgi:hypothetical protein